MKISHTIAWVSNAIHSHARYTICDFSSRHVQSLEVQYRIQVLSRDPCFTHLRYLFEEMSHTCRSLQTIVSEAAVKCYLFVPFKVGVSAAVVQVPFRSDLHQKIKLSVVKTVGRKPHPRLYGFPLLG